MFISVFHIFTFIYSVCCTLPFFPKVRLSVGKIISEGRPPKPTCSPPCHRYARCLQDPKTGKYKCSCSRPCPRIYSPVCGTDGITYGSECMLMYLVCEKGTDVGLKHRGECKKGQCLRLLVFSVISTIRKCTRGFRCWIVHFTASSSSLGKCVGIL